MTAMAASNASVSAFLTHVEILSTTKDSISVTWRSRDEYVGSIHGYKVRYQAVGSGIVQYSHQLTPGTSVYDITQLHENTFYDVCVRVVTNQSLPQRQVSVMSAQRQDSVVSAQRQVSVMSAQRQDIVMSAQRQVSVMSAQRQDSVMSA